MNTRTIAICIEADQANVHEEALHRLLQLPLCNTAELCSDKSAIDYFLKFEADGLTLFLNEAKAPGGVRVDFASATLDRRAMDSLVKQNLGKAVGIKGAVKPRVLDATAGLGVDAFLLANAGCEVLMLERSAIVHAMLRDGMQRGLAVDEGTVSALQRLSLLQADFLDPDSNFENFDVIYLDPMFPQSGKSARAKKAMYLLQGMLGHGEDEASLLEKALQLAGSRVVVKRGKLSPVLAGLEPDITFRGNSNRFDVYLIN